MILGYCEGRFYLVNVAENSFLDRLVLDDLAEDTAVTTADDKDFLGVGVGVHGEVGDHFLVSTKRTPSPVSNFRKTSQKEKRTRTHRVQCIE